MSAPTPGPWNIEENVLAGGVRHLAVTNRADKNWMPCSVTRMDLRRDVDDANARLITAAPDLLAALMRILGNYKSAMLFAGQTPEGFETSSDVVAARAAISKATGEQP